MILRLYTWAGVLMRLPYFVLCPSKLFVVPLQTYMVTKAQIKFVRSLQQKKFRDEARCFVAEGDKLINELKAAFELELLINKDNATTKEIEQMSSLRTPQGSIAVFKQRPTSCEQSLTCDNQLILVLDTIQDPGNLGTIIRTADWFGVRHIVCSSDTADCYNPKVVQATMGALARVQIHYTDLPTFLHNQPANTPIYGTLLEGESLYEQPLTHHGIIIMGNEGNGISPAVRSYINTPLYIPPYPADATTVESLNVAIATAVTLAAFRHP